MEKPALNIRLPGYCERPLICRFGSKHTIISEQSLPTEHLVISRELGQKSTEPYRSPQAILVLGQKQTEKTRQLRVLQSLPGFGPDGAKRLLERFGTLRACFDSSKTELLKVEGIGPKTAAAIDQLLS